MNKYTKSLELLTRSERVTPGQSQTFSKGWTQYPKGVSPVFAEKAHGSYVWDVDGNKYIDWPMALGPLLLGHNYYYVNDAVKKQLNNGIAFSLPTKTELELSERLIDWFPYAERVRFGKNGSDATTGAVRAARAYTGRNKILCCGYHGWHDWFIGTTSRNKGVPKETQDLTKAFPFNDIDAFYSLLAKYKQDVAAIIIEPMGLIKPACGFLESIRKAANDNGIVLIFDECWTGFRIDLQGAYGAFGVTPDLACFGKAIGNGVPISVVLGQADIMDVFNDTFYSFTFGGDLLGITAANAVLDVLENEPVLEHIDKVGSKLMSGINTLLEVNGLDNDFIAFGYPARNAINFKDDHNGLLIKSVFQQEALKQGILTSGWHATSYAHTEEDVNKTLSIYEDVFSKLSSAINSGVLEKLLKGDVVQPVFRSL